MVNIGGAAQTPSLSDGVDFVFRMGREKIADQIQTLDALDTKIAVILGFAAISIVEVLGFLILATAEGVDPGRHFPVSAEVFFLLGLTCAVLATLFGLLAMRSRKFALGFKYGEMVRKANRPPGEICLLFLDDVCKSCMFNTEALEMKQRWSTITLLFAALSLFFYSIASALLFICLTRRG